jgi:hypothetical protein
MMGLGRRDDLQTDKGAESALPLFERQVAGQPCSCKPTIAQLVYNLVQSSSLHDLAYRDRMVSSLSILMDVFNIIEKAWPIDIFPHGVESKNARRDRAKRSHSETVARGRRRSGVVTSEVRFIGKVAIEPKRHPLINRTGNRAERLEDTCNTLQLCKYGRFGTNPPQYDVSP